MDNSNSNADFSVVIFQDNHSQVKLVKSVLIIFACILILFEINNLVYLELYIHLEFLAGLVIFAFLYNFVTRDTTNIVAGLALWTMTILASYIAWENEGLYDTAIIAFPCILIFASLLSGRLLIYNLAAYMLLVFYFFAYSYSTGFIESKIIYQGSLWEKANNLAIILIIYGAGITLISSRVANLLQLLYSEQQKNEKIQLNANRLITYDLLTKLPNEVLCKKQLLNMLENSKYNEGIIGFLTLDLDNFKWVNSSFGHDVGDKVLILLAEKLANLGDEKTYLYHTSGKQFTLLKQVIDYEELSLFSTQVIGIISTPFNIDSYEIEMSCSVGIAIAPFDGSNYELLWRKSNTALAKAKDNNDSNTIMFFEIEMEQAINKRAQVLHDLKHALERNEFVLYYQPKVNLDNQVTQSVEALIRWNKGGTEIIPPIDFIQIAEESGLINDIGTWAIEKACFDCKQWDDLYGIKISVAVNLSPLQFRQGNLPNIVFRALSKSKLDPNFLELEITESLFIKDTDYIKDQIYEITKKGVSIAIDDFGTGYSNLNYLTKFNASILKIDMSFVRNMLVSEQQRYIVAAIIKMTSSLKMKNVAEGVENKETYELLKELGCQYGQGYYWSKPLPNQEFINWFKKQ